MKNVSIAKSIVLELDALLVSVEAIGALVAGAHIETAILALCKEFNLPRDGSRSD